MLAHIPPSLVSRRVRKAGETEKRAATVPVPALAPAPAPETGITNTTSPGKRDATKATATRTGVAAVPQRNPRIKRGADTDERRVTELDTARLIWHLYVSDLNVLVPCRIT